MSEPIQALLAVMERLRAADGCPWDRAQTFASLVPFTLEEAYEVADAVERNDPLHLKEELGDLLFQVVFYSQLAREAGQFDFAAVAAGMAEKLERRHPHLFDPAFRAAEGATLSAERQSAMWEDIKAAERAAANEARPGEALPGGMPPSALHGVPLALPALMRAFKLSKRAARVGFDFEHADATADKVAEELAEVRAAVAAAAAIPAQGPSRDTVEEVGDLLFAAANLARKLDVDAEAALRAANLKFERRFGAMERLCRQRGQEFAGLGLPAQEALWHEVKRAE